MKHYKKEKNPHSTRPEFSEFPSESAIFGSATDGIPEDTPEGSSIKRAGLMDKDGFRRDLSMKRANSMDKEHFRRQLSMKRANFMDKDEFRGDLSMKRANSMDREEVLLTNNIK